MWQENHRQYSEALRHESRAVQTRFAQSTRLMF
jgi:hypothetical protein